MSVPIDKARKLQQECHRALSQPYLSICALTSLLDRMLACSPGMFLAPLPSAVEDCSPSSPSELPCHGTPEARTELAWWAADLETWDGRSILKPPAQLTIFSDASLLGWGAVCSTTSTGGQWSPTEANLHINALEFIVASFAVKAFHHRASYRPLHIKLLIDNTTAVSNYPVPDRLRSLEMGGPTRYPPPGGICAERGEPSGPSFSGLPLRVWRLAPGHCSVLQDSESDSLDLGARSVRISTEHSTSRLLCLEAGS